MTQAVAQVRNVVSRTGFANPLTLGVLVTDSNYVYVYADDELLTEGADYVITGIGSVDGVEIEIIGAEDPDNYVGVETFTAVFDPPLDQPSDLSSGGVLGRSFELGLDQANRRLQALADKVGRALRLTPNMDIDGELPWPPTDAFALVWDEDLQRVVWADPTGSSVYADAAAASAAEAAADAAAALASAAAAAASAGNAATAETAAEAAQAAAELAQAAAEAAQAAAEAAVADALPKAGGTMTGPIGFTHQASPANPAAGVLALFAKSDNKFYSRTSAGVETEIGSGAAGVIGVVANVAALAALDETLVTTAYLKELAREGMFLFNAADLSAQVTADAAQDVYVAPASDTTGASGAWVRVGAVQSNFWENQSPRGRIHRLADRVFVGDAVVNDGQIPVVVEDWLEAFRSSTTTNAQFASLSTIGQIGVLGGSRTSDFNTPGSEGCIGGSFWSLNDNATNLQSSYSLYLESVRYAGAGTTHGMEIDSVNNGSVVDVQPYGAYDHSSGVTNALWLAAGGGYATADSSVAMFVLDNGMQFRKGIVFKATALDTNIAIEMATSHYINWVSADGTSKSVIRSDTNNSGALQRLIFANSGTFLQNSVGKTVVHIYNDANRVNALQIVPGDTGTAVSLNAIGDDTNINLDLAGKGTGTVRSASGVVSSHATQGVGYRTGAGGTVTQLTSKATGVTLSKVSGQITTHNAALAAATIVSFTLTNTAIAAGDVLVLNHVSGGTLGAYTLNAACAAGSATITLRNNTAGSLSEALVLGFALIKGVTS